MSGAWDKLTSLYICLNSCSWLEVKAVLASKNRKVAMTSKRKWKKHWGGCMLACISLISTELVLSLCMLCLLV